VSALTCRFVLVRMDACVRPGCPHRHQVRPRSHGYCCEACKGKPYSHTEDCSGSHSSRRQTIIIEEEDPGVLAGFSNAGQFADATARPIITPLRMNFGASLEPLTLPAAWLRGALTAMDYVKWYATRYSLSLRGVDATRVWQALSEHLMNRVERESFRTLRLFAHRRDRIPRLLEDAFATVDVADVGIDGHSQMYKITRVTGVDCRVQAVVAMHAATAEALLEAIQMIESRDVREFAFLCHGATHRSVACCFLLAALAYPRAEIYLTTKRTHNDAERFGLYARPNDFASRCFSWQQGGAASDCSRGGVRGGEGGGGGKGMAAAATQGLLGGEVAGFSKLTAGEAVALH